MRGEDPGDHLGFFGGEPGERKRFVGIGFGAGDELEIAAAVRADSDAFPIGR